MLSSQSRILWMKRALLVWIIIFTTLVFWAIRTNRQNTESNKATIITVASSSARIDQLQREEDASCTNYIILRDAVNDFHSTLGSFLHTAENARRAAYRKSHSPSDLKAANVYKFLRLHAARVNASCAQKTSIPPLKKPTG